MTKDDCTYELQYMVDISKSNLVSPPRGYPNAIQMLAHMIDYLFGATENRTDVLGIRVRTTP